MVKLILSTGNIVSGGPSIIRKPGAYRSNLELTNSLRSNFLAAQQDYAEEIPESNGSGLSDDSTDFLRDGSEPALAPVSAWTEQEGDVIYVPRIDWSTAGLQEEPSQYDITVKLFFLPTAPISDRAQYAKEALDLVLKELQVPEVGLLIVSFPGMSFEGDCEWEADRVNASQGNDEDEIATWLAIEDLHRRGLVKNLGIAEFGTEKLARFLKKVQIRPTANQINIKNCCNVPPPLIKLAKDQGIELLVHTDTTDILSHGTLRGLLGPGLQGAGVLADPEDDTSEGLKGDLTPQWVVKYTAVVRDRGVIENKGYFASAGLTTN
ncbi:glutamate-cysteine ligase modifier subunit [Apodospora peruviana]|uniref:GCS light chain n=1 Tax=Apodospora peruviana TaxID=516989 RepID=A0AAE0IIW9_9PEZI|nr:glutamate-cysteine ligase modifier subunit [Apodospora peruviana]